MRLCDYTDQWSSKNKKPNEVFQRSFIKLSVLKETSKSLSLAFLYTVVWKWQPCFYII